MYFLPTKLFFMEITTDIQKIKEVLTTAQEILIVTHEHPTFDSIGSALALYLGLTGLGKKVTIACPDPVTVDLSSFIGVNKIIPTIGKKNFIISLDYVDGSIEKVSYNIEGKKFNLVVEPRPGFEIFSQDKVHYSYAGSSANVIFTIDTIHLGGLTNVYEDDKELFTVKPIVNIDRHANNAHYGHTNVVDPQASSTAELVLQILTGLDIAITEDIATNILNAVYWATENFQNPAITAKAFEAAAVCMKAGGKRFTQKTEKQEEIPVSGGESVSHDLPHMEKSTPQAPVHTTAVTPGKLPTSEKHPTAPPDWLKPKIFKSTNISS